MANANILLQNIRPRFDPAENRRKVMADTAAQMQLGANMLSYQKGIRDLQRSEAMRKAAAGAPAGDYDALAAAIHPYDPMAALGIMEKGRAAKASDWDLRTKQIDYFKTGMEAVTPQSYPAFRSHMIDIGMDAGMLPETITEDMQQRIVLGLKDRLEFGFKEREEARAQRKEARDQSAQARQNEQFFEDYGRYPGGGSIPQPQPIGVATPGPGPQPIGVATPGVGPEPIPTPVRPNPDDPRYRGRKGAADLRADQKVFLDYQKEQRALKKEQKEIFEQKQQFKRRLSSTRDKRDLVVKTIKKIRALMGRSGFEWGPVNLPDYGYGAGVASLLPGDANKIKPLLKTLIGNVGFGELQAMRDASPTGGAVGQLSDRELVLLASMLGNLDITNPDLPGSLDEIEGAMNRLVRYMEEDYSNWDQVILNSSPPAQQQMPDDPLGIR